MKTIYKMNANGYTKFLELVIGCKFNCPYCCSRSIAKNYGLIKNEKDWRYPTVKNNSLHLLETEAKNLTEEDEVMVCSTTDPFQCDSITKLHIEAIRIIIKNARVGILTKGIIPIEQLCNIPRTKIRFGITIDGRNEIRHKIGILKELHEMGYYVSVSAQPIDPDLVISIYKQVNFVDEFFFGQIGYVGLPKKNELKKCLDISNVLFKHCQDVGTTLFNDQFIRKLVSLNYPDFITPKTWRQKLRSYEASENTWPAS